MNPDAAEQCNEYDDNCDGSVDEGVATFIWYVDFDEDGYGDATQPTTESCSMWWGYAIRADDCDDTDPMMSPGMDADLDGESVCTGLRRPRRRQLPGSDGSRRWGRQRLRRQRRRRVVTNACDQIRDYPDDGRRRLCFDEPARHFFGRAKSSEKAIADEGSPTPPSA